MIYLMQSNMVHSFNLNQIRTPKNPLKLFDTPVALKYKQGHGKL